MPSIERACCLLHRSQAHTVRPRSVPNVHRTLASARSAPATWRPQLPHVIVPSSSLPPSSTPGSYAASDPPARARGARTAPTHDEAGRTVAILPASWEPTTVRSSLLTAANRQPYL